jgi:cytochrome c oxidase subunit 1
MLFFNATFFPMHQVGIGGMMRRIYDPLQYEYMQPMAPTNRFITIAALLLITTQFIFAFNFIWSMFRGARAEANPWRANSLEWAVPSPPPHGNFTEMPHVYRGAYEYSLPDQREDYLPQNVPPGVPAPTPVHAS